MAVKRSASPKRKLMRTRDINSLRNGLHDSEWAYEFSSNSTASTAKMNKSDTIANTSAAVSLFLNT